MAGQWFYVSRSMSDPNQRADEYWNSLPVPALVGVGVADVAKAAFNAGWNACKLDMLWSKQLESKRIQSSHQRRIRKFKQAHTI
jgi:hypothetical protein